jgi:F-type H+-transporting ATPase subunit epsilon
MLSVTVISPERVLYEGKADYVRLPGVDGSFGVMQDHAPLVALVDVGVLDIESGSTKTNMVIDGGFVEVKSNSVNVMVYSGSLRSDLKKETLLSQLQEIEKSDLKNKVLELKKTKVRITLLENP